MLNFGSWVTKICGRCGRHLFTTEKTKGFFAEMTMFARVFVGDVALLTRDEVEELVLITRRIEKEGVEVESQDEERWDFSNESPLLL